MIQTKAQARRNFETQVESWIAEAFKAGARSFPELLARLPGVYPPVALDVLHRMKRQARLSPEIASTVERQIGSSGRATTPTPNDLPPPHPLDFEWRFTKRTARELLTLAHSLTKPNDRVVLLGTPAVAAIATAAPIDRATVFVGEDNVITNAIVALNDRNGRPLAIQTCKPQALLPTNAGVVILDPPWYFDFIRPILTIAASSCRVGGFVLLSLLPIGTRSGAAQDRARIAHYLRRLSLESVEERQSALAYETPFFEANALAAAGFTRNPGDWRRSDLLVLRKTRHSDPTVFDRTTPVQWRETTVRRMRLFIRSNVLGSARSGAAMRSLLPGDVLPSVSRRDPRRRKAQLWTSGNRIFASRRPELVLAAAMQARNGAALLTRSQLSNVEQDEVKRLSYDLLTLAAKEEHEERNGRIEEASCLSENSTSDSIASSVTSRMIVSG
jgi:hypothetical protein